jgi:membrane protease YdiL (CAAX protease family)
VTRLKGSILVLEGFLVLQAAHFVGGEYLTVAMLRRYTDLPVITAATVATSNLSHLLAILYMALRFRDCPAQIIGPNLLTATGGGIILGWLLTFLGLIVFDRTSPYVQEILRLPVPYVYHGIFSVIVWHPLTEELLARGVFFEILRRGWGLLTSALISSSLFVLSHGIWGDFDPGLLLIASYSLIFTLVYIHGGVIGAAFVHMAVNAYLIYLNT